MVRFRLGTGVAFVLAMVMGALVPGVAHADDTTPPSTPTNLRADTTFTHTTTTWDPSTDDSGRVTYVVEFSGSGHFSRWAALGTEKTFGPAPEGVGGNLVPGGTYAATVWAKDPAGNLSEPASVETTIPVDTVPPSAPSNLRFEMTQGFIPGVIAWDASTDNQDDIVYTLYKEDPEHGGDDGLYQIWRTRQTQVSVSDLNGAYMVFPGDTLTLRVVARDVGDNASPVSAPLTHTFEF